MATLADVNKTLQAVEENTQQTGGAINKFIAYMESRRGDELETQRELKKSVSQRAAAAASKAGSAVTDKARGMIGGLSNLQAISLAALPAAFMSRAVRRGIPAMLGVTFADEIADYLLGSEGDAELKKQLEMAITGGSIGLIFGKKFAVLGAALGYLSANDKVTSEIDRLSSNAYDLAEKLGIGAFFNEQSFAAFAKGLADTIGSGVGAFADLLEGDFSGFFSDIDDALITLGTLSLLISPRLTTKAGKATLRGLLQTFKKAGPIGKAVAAVGLAMGLDYATGAGDESGIGATEVAVAGAVGYGGFKAIQNANTRVAPSQAQIAEQVASNSRMPDKTRVIGKTKTGQNVVTNSKGKGQFIQGADGKATVTGVKDFDMKKSWWSKYPRMSKMFVKGLGRGFPLGLLFGAMEVDAAYAIANDPSLSEDEKKKRLGAMAFANIGALGMSALGGMLGSLAGPVGTVAGLAIGGGVGYMSGDWLGYKLMDFMMGNQSKSYWDAEATKMRNQQEAVYAENYKGYESIGMGGVGLRAANQFERVYSDIDPDDLGNAPTAPPARSSNMVDPSFTNALRNNQAPSSPPVVAGQIGDNVVSSTAFNNLPQGPVMAFDPNGMLWQSP